MADAGFFKGTSAEQDSRFANKQKKLLKQMKFPDNIDVKIDMLKISLDVIKPWITKRLQELLGIEDDVVIEFVFNQLEDKNPDPKMMQINLTGFLGGSKARLFIGELWKFLASAQSSPDGIPAELVEMKKKELLKLQEEDDRLREIRKREEDSHRQDTKPDIEKLDSKLNIRNQMSSSSNRSRNENGNNVGYKSRAFYEDNRRDRDRRRSPEKTRRPRESPEPKARRTEKKSTRSVSKSSDNEDDRHHRQEKNKSSSSNRHDRHRPPSKSPSHSRSPIKSSRKNEKRQQRSPSSSSTASNASHKAIEKPPTRSSSSSSVDRSHKKTNNLSDKKTKIQAVSNTKPVPVKETVSSKSKKNKKPSKRTRSVSSNSRSSSNSSVSRSTSSSSSSSEVQSKKNKKPKRSPSPVRNRKSDTKKDDHKSRKQSKSSSRKHHRSNDNKRKSHRDHPDKSKTRKNHRNESSKKKISKSSDHEILPPSSPKKPRLESQIKVQTPPPSDDHKTEQQVVPIKPNRTERIVVLEGSRSDSIGSISTRVSITTKSMAKNEHPMTNNSSEDENEVDLRERLLREKAIKSMRRRQLSTNNNDLNTKTTNDRIVYETQ